MSELPIPRCLIDEQRRCKYECNKGAVGANPPILLIQRESALSARRHWKPSSRTKGKGLSTQEEKAEVGELVTIEIAAGKEKYTEK